MIDTHCHLYLDDFKDKIEDYIERAKKSSVERIFLPAIDSDTHQDVIDLNNKFPAICLPMMGLHPCSVKENFTEELHLVEELLTRHNFYGIGETGLDFYWDKTYVAFQEKSLRRHIELALKYELPLILHTRNATAETIKIVAEYKSPDLRGIFHCFGDAKEEALEIIDLGFLLGIGGIVTYKNGGLDKVLPHIGLEYLVLETDAPYLSPAPHRGKQNEPSYLPLIADRIAEIKETPVAKVVEQTTVNAKKLFGIT